MELFRALKKVASRKIDISRAQITLPISPPVVTHSRQQTILTDILNEPEKFEIVMYIEGNEIVMRARRRCIDATESNSRI